MIATYRLQLHPEFDFAAVEALVPYFRRLGISHLYLSPITEARPGSIHGYDVVDHNAVREELGGRAGFNRLLETAREAGLELILDFVPNHAGVGPQNASWQNTLAYGPHAAHADYFDIDWRPLKPELLQKILLPFLGRPYGEALDEGEITLVYEAGRFYAAYYDNRFAISPRTYAGILEPLLPRFERTDAYWDLKDLHEAYASLEPAEREKAEALRPRLEALAEALGADVLSTALEEHEALHALLEKQYWRLAFWKTASYEVNYRRFFSINNLVALRMEDEHVFWDAHQLLGELLAQSGVAGVRIDHIDGLSDPHQYLARLRDLGAARIWVEKILAPGEKLPEGWPVEGTTGYEFMNDAMGVLLQPEGELPLSRTYRRFVPRAASFEEVAYRSKKLVIDNTLSSEISRLAYGLDRLSEADYHTRDFTLEALRDALTEVVAAFDRYRTYLPYGEEDTHEVIQEIIYRARQHNPAAEPTVYDFIAEIILGEVPEDLQAARRAWTDRLQQYTAPVAAKGVEDTAFYRYLQLVALNEVGGDPEPFAQSVQAFQAHARFRALRYPRNLLATATHDHKRGEDTRMRLIALSEVPDLWDETAHALDAIGADYRGAHGPSRYDAYLFYQTLAALWEGADLDALPDRLSDYMQKASRESKRRTSWINPDEDYEGELEAFVRGVIADERTPEALGTLARTLARCGFLNSLSQLLLKCTTPGVPDFYQGCELLDLSLVDPDNRRPVDYARRRELLDELGDLLATPDAAALHDLIETQNERVKFYLTARLLQLRKAHEPLFTEGSHQALKLEGADAGHWLAFARSHGAETLVVLVPRHFSAFDGPKDAVLSLPEALSAGSWTELLSGETLEEEGGELDTKHLPLPWALLLTRTISEDDGTAQDTSRASEAAASPPSSS